MYLKNYSALVLLLYSFACFSQGDECDNATEIPNVSNYCSAAGEFNNSTATPSAFGAPACWPNKGNDVWFKFTAIAFDLTVTVNGNIAGNGTLIAPQVALYEGDCGGAITMLDCQTAQAAKNTVTFYRGTIKIGNEYYLRISAANDHSGTFQLCVNNFIQTIKPGQDCLDATYLCNKNPVSVTSISGSGNDKKEGAGTCLHTGGQTAESNSTWYTWEADNNGTLTFSLMPSSPKDDVDFALFEIPPSGCKNKKVLRCSGAGRDFITPGDTSCWGETGLNMTSVDTSEDAGCAPPNDKFVKYINQVEGRTYALLIEGFNNPNGAVNLSFGGTGLFKGPKPSFSVSSSTVCVGESITYINTSKGALSYSWDFGAGASPATATTEGPHQVTYNTPGQKTVVLVVTGKGGCVMTSVQKVVIDPCLITVSLKDTAICPGRCAVLKPVPGGAGPFTYSWSDGSNADNAIVCPTVTSTYTVTATGALNRTASATATVTVYDPPKIDAGGDVSICPGTAATLTASGGTSYSWSPATGLSSTTDQTVIANPPKTITYTVTASDANGCSNTDAVQVVVVAPDGGKVSPDVAICTGQSTQLVAEGGSTYAWMPPTGLNQTTGPLVTASPMTKTTYTVVIYNDPCPSDTEQVTVSVHPRPVANFTDTAGCAPLEATLKSKSTGAATYKWYFYDDGNASASQNPVKTYTKPGLHTAKLVVTSAYGCKDSITKTAALVYPDPVASFYANPKIASVWEPKIHFLNTSSGALKWVWSFGDDSTSFLNKVTHTYKDTGKYQVCLEVVNQYGCTSKTCDEVIVQPDWTIFIPNAFTPNGDGINDHFIAKGTFIKEYEMWIFDRWGNMIYYCNDMNKPWNGTLNNQGATRESIMQIDTYVYRIRVKDIFDKKHNYYGHVNLIK